MSAFSACGPDNGGFRVRVAGLAPALSRCGVRLEARPLLGRGEDRRFAAGGLLRRVAVGARARVDLGRHLKRRPPASSVLIHRQADLFPLISLERRICADRHLVLDVDDAVWLHPARGRAIVDPRKLRWLAARADRVLAGNAYLAEWFERHSGRVAIVPSLVDVDALRSRAHAEGDELVIGWIGSPSTARYLEPVLESLPRVAGALAPTQLVLEAVGAQIPSVRGVTVRAVPWSEAAERASLARMDVGIMPLSDDRWTRGKCGYKALLYMTGGVPVVADDVGGTSELVGGAGHVVRGADGWVDALVALLRDRSARARMGSTGRRRVEANYSLQAWAPTIASLLAPG